MLTHPKLTNNNAINIVLKHAALNDFLSVPKLMNIIIKTDTNINMPYMFPPCKTSVVESNKLLKSFLFVIFSKLIIVNP